MRGCVEVLLGLLNVYLVTARFIQGELRTSQQDWAFVARFCFLSHYGRFEYSIEYTKEFAFQNLLLYYDADTQWPSVYKTNKEFAFQNLLLYYDADTQWPSVYKTNKTCDQKQGILKRELLQIVPLHPEESDSGCVETPSPSRRSTATIYCNSSKSFRSARERWWFLAISHCNSTKGLSLKYTFLMTNGAPGDFWHEHFSADQFYIMPVLMGFSTLYILLILATVICCKELRSRQLLHSTYKLFSFSVVLQEVGIFVQSIAYMQFAISGVESIALRDLGRLCESASEIFFLLVLLLLAKGYTVTRGRLRLGSSIKLTIFMCLYTVCYWFLFLYEREYFDPGEVLYIYESPAGYLLIGLRIAAWWMFITTFQCFYLVIYCVAMCQYFDPGEVLYIYESPAGYGLIGLRIAAWWMFIYSTIFTLKHYPEKATFYYPFNLIGTLWFVAGPAFILCANTFIDKWARESIVCFVHHMIAACGHILFLMLTVPSKANKNFPYHVRTTQIGVMEVTDGTLGNNTLDHFGHHPYALGGPPLGRPETRNYGYWDQPITETDTVFKFSRPATTNTSDCLIVRPEEILPVPDFTAPSHRHNIYLPS